MSIAKEVQLIAAQAGFSILAKHEIEPRPASFAPIPQELDVRVKGLLEEKYSTGLFEHQAKAIGTILDGKDVSVSTCRTSN